MMLQLHFLCSLFLIINDLLLLHALRKVNNMTPFVR